MDDAAAEDVRSSTFWRGNGSEVPTGRNDNINYSHGFTARPLISQRAWFMRCFHSLHSKQRAFAQSIYFVDSQPLAE